MPNDTIPPNLNNKESNLSDDKYSDIFQFIANNPIQANSGDKDSNMSDTENSDTVHLIEDDPITDTFQRLITQNAPPRNSQDEPPRKIQKTNNNINTQITAAMVPPSHAHLYTNQKNIIPAFEQSHPTHAHQNIELATFPQTDNLYEISFFSPTNTEIPTLDAPNISNSTKLTFNASTKYQLQQAIIILECFLEFNKKKFTHAAVAEKAKVKQLQRLLCQRFQAGSMPARNFSELKKMLNTCSKDTIEKLIAQLKTDADNPSWKPAIKKQGDLSTSLKKAKISELKYGEYKQNLAIAVAKASDCEENIIASFVDDILRRLIKKTSPVKTIEKLIEKYVLAFQLIKDKSGHNDTAVRKKILRVVNHDGGGRNLDSLIKHLQSVDVFLEACQSIQEVGSYFDFMFTSDYTAISMTVQTKSTAVIKYFALSDLQEHREYNSKIHTVINKTPSLGYMGSQPCSKEERELIFPRFTGQPPSLNYSSFSQTPLAYSS